MISPLIYQRIKNKAKSDERTIPSNYKDILHRYKHINNVEGNRIAFSWLSDSGSTILNATSMIPRFVVLNAEWAARVVLYDSKRTMNAFKITVGHELTHKDKEICRLKYWGNDRKFVARVNEVRADFGGAKRMCGSNRNALLKAIKYKKALQKNDNGDFAHPPWAKRYEYVEKNDFGAELIGKIADEVECFNEELREYVTNYYEEIILIPPPKKSKSFVDKDDLARN